jgi:ribosomal protein L22
MADEKTPEELEAEVEAAEKTEAVSDEAAEATADAEAAEAAAAEAPAEKKPRRRSRRKKADAAAEEPVAEEAAEAVSEDETVSDGDEPVSEDDDAGDGEEPQAEEKPRRRRRKAAEEAEPKPAKRQRPRVEYAPGEAPIVRAQAKYVRTSARKARLVCDHIRGKSVVEARAILAHTPRAVAADWEKLLSSAVANAEHNHELLGDELRILSITADEGPTLKRFRPRAKGRADRIRKRTSHLTITLTPED